MMRNRIAVLNNEPNMSDCYRKVIEACGYETLPLNDPTLMRSALRNTRPDVFICDISIAGRTSLDLINELKELQPTMPVVVFTASTSVEAAVETIKAGAFDYVVKPFTPDNFRKVMVRAINSRETPRITREPTHLPQSVKYETMIGTSFEMQKLSELVQKVARTDANVLIQGESGSGKEVVAHCIHAHSARANNPFVPLDCASIPEALLESELFGYQKGAFTGATVNKPGLLETANGGSIFLDEIGEMPLGLQSKLLRVIQERTFRPVGSTATRSTNVRVITATNRDLDVERRNKRFREDLYYRLGVITVQVPSLRERAEDVPLLAQEFARQFARRSGIKFSRITPQAMNLLSAYTWPGNVRELQNVMERALTLGNGEMITADDLPESIRNGGSSADRPSYSGNDFKLAKDGCIEAFEREHLIKWLEEHSYNLSKIARLSGLNRRTIYRMMKKHNIYNKRANEMSDHELENDTGTYENSDYDHVPERLQRNGARQLSDAVSSISSDD